jgi:hypothetical protein
MAEDKYRRQWPELTRPTGKARAVGGFEATLALDAAKYGQHLGRSDLGDGP